MIVLIVTLILASLLWIILDNIGRRKVPPGPLKIPIFGNSFQITLADNLTGPAYYKLSKKYGDIMSLKTGTLDSIVLSSYEVIRDLFAKDELSDRQCDGPGLERNMNRNMGIIFSSGKIWKDLRRFTLRNLRDFGFSKTNLMENAQQEEFQYFRDYLKEKLKNTDDGVISIHGFFNLSVLNVIWSMIMSERFPYDDPKLKHYIRLNDLSNNFVSSWSLFFPFLRTWFIDIQLKLNDDFFHRHPGRIIFSSGKIWKDLRRFTLRNLRDFGFSKTNLMENAQQDEFQYFRDYLKEKLKNTDDGVISIHGFFNLSVLNVIWSMIMSERFPYDDPKLKHYIRLNVLSNNFVSSWSLFFPFLRTWFPEKSGRNAVLNSVGGLQDFIRGLIHDCRRKEIYKVNPQNLVDVFLEKIESEENDPNTSFTDDQLLITMLDIFQAGIETTSNLMSWTILFLILNPHVQDKIYEEISRMVPKGERITLDYKNRMPYIHATILEAHRRSQIIPIAIAHKVVTDFEYRGYLFKEGTPVFANTYAVLINEELFPDPDKFIPERFLNVDGSIDKRKAEIARIVFLPGKRLCIGESVAESTFFMYLVGLVQMFEFRCVPGQAQPSTEPQVGFANTPHPFDVQIQVRDNRM